MVGKVATALNISKCKSLYLHFGKIQSYTQEVDNEKDLGITIDDLMKFHLHNISFTTSKAFVLLVLSRSHL